MAFKQADDYNTVAERIVEFREKYPEGSLQPLDLAHPYDFRMIDGKEAVVVVAAAYRTPDDPRPGIGMAYEPIPGPTQFTRGSELQNAETAAWGRALIAVGAADAKKGIASRDEVMANRDRESSYDRRPEPAQERPVPTDDDLVMEQRRLALQKLADGINSLDQADRAVYLERWQDNGLPKMKELNNDEYGKAVFLLRTLKGEIAQRTIENPAAAPDHAAPPSDYMTEEPGA
jgi:hypothetical protein